MKMTTMVAVVSSLLLFASCTKEGVSSNSPEVKANWTSDNSTNDYTSKYFSPYTVYNNVWGSGAGYQSIWANSGSNWGIWSNHPASGGIKSYPNSERKINRSMSSLSSCTSSFNVGVPSDGSWGADYDVWTSGDLYELMLWMNYRGSVGPIASSYPNGVGKVEYSNVNVGGHTWNIYRGNKNSQGKQVISFLRTSNTTSGTVNILAIMNYLKNTRGWIGNETIDRVQFGFEITSTAGGRNHSVNSYSVSYN